MYRTLATAALAALVGRGMAADFANMTWGPVTVGSMWPISWSAGDGTAVALHLSNATWDYTIFTNLPATPGVYDWTISVPAGFAEGNYELNLVQGDDIASSPIFGVSFTTLPPISSMNATVAPTLATTMSTSMTPNATVTVSPTITVVCPVIWYDESCGCRSTTTSPVVMPSPTNSQYVWHDQECGCSKTAVIPSATAMPACSNCTAPMTTPQPAAPVAPATTGPAVYPGAASNVKYAGSMFAAVVFAAVAFAL